MVFFSHFFNALILYVHISLYMFTFLIFNWFGFNNNLKFERIIWNNLIIRLYSYIFEYLCMNSLLSTLYTLQSTSLGCSRRWLGLIVPNFSMCKLVSLSYLTYLQYFINWTNLESCNIDIGRFIIVKWSAAIAIYQMSTYALCSVSGEIRALGNYSTIVGVGGA